MIDHHLVVCQGARPIKHEENYQAPEKQENITQEANKLQEAGIAREATHPEWIVNPTPFARPRNSARMCVDFIALNQARPASPFPSSRINQIAGSSGPCACFSA